MSSKQLFYVFTSLLILLGLAVVGAAYGADAVLSAKAGELSKRKAESQAIDEVQASLTRNKADLTRYHELNEIAKAIVPQDKNQTETVREIVKIANDSGISKLSSITFPASTLGVTGTAKTSTSLTQLTAVPGMSGVYALPITVTVSEENAVPYERLITFLRGLEQNRRTAQVTNLTLTPSTKASNIAFTLVINEYIKP